MTLIVLLSGSALPATAQSSTWGVELGDIAIYYLDDVRFADDNLPDLDEANLALGLTEENRTTVVVITHIDNNFVNYSLGLANNTNIIFDQQVKIEEQEIEGTSFVLPSGDLPLVLPLSTGTQSDYFEYLANSVILANSLIGSFIGGENSNFSFVDDAILSSNVGNTLRISADAKISNVSNVTDFTDMLNMTDDIITINENQTISSGNVSLTVNYNTTDGMLTSFNLSSQLLTNSTTAEGFELNNLNFSASIIRQEFIRLLDNEELEKSASSIAESPFYWLAGLPALFVLINSRKK